MLHSAVHCFGPLVLLYKLLQNSSDKFIDCIDRCHSFGYALQDTLNLKVRVFCRLKYLLSAQGMVTRSDYLAALSEVKASKEDAAARAKDLSWMQSQHSKTQEQLSSARLEIAKLETVVSGMVRQIRESTKEKVRLCEEESRSQHQRHEDSTRSLNQRLSELDKDKTALIASIQVAFPTCTSLRCMCSFTAYH